MTIDVVPLSEADIPEAIEIIQTAFADDPYFTWVFDADKVCSLPAACFCLCFLVSPPWSYIGWVCRSNWDGLL